MDTQTYKLIRRCDGIVIAWGLTLDRVQELKASYESTYGVYYYWIEGLTNCTANYYAYSAPTLYTTYA